MDRVTRTAIEWTDFSVNPLRFRTADGRTVWGCLHASPGCQHCYAETLARRYRRGGPFNVATMATLTPFLDDAELRRMLTAKTVAGQPVAGARCFVGDMTDVFGEWVSDEMLDRLFAVFALRLDVTWQILTKRAARLRDYLSYSDRATLVARQIPTLNPNHTWESARAAIFGIKLDERPPQSRWPLPNVWLGVSAEDQQRADDRIPDLLQTPAAVRFVSVEPLLAHIDLSRALSNGTTFHLSVDVEGSILNRAFDYFNDDDGHPFTRAEAEARLRALHAAGVKRIRTTDACEGFSDQDGCPGHRKGRLDWVIVGGESGPDARPCQVRWIRSMVEQCAECRVPCFVKQLGSNVRDRNDAGWDADSHTWADGADAGEPVESAAWPDRIADEDRVQHNPNGWREAYQGAPVRVRLPGKGGDPAYWPHDLRVRAFPEVRA